MTWHVYANGEFVAAFKKEHEAAEEKRLLRRLGLTVTVKVTY